MTALLLPATLVLLCALLTAWLLPGAAHVLRRRVLLLGMVTLAVMPGARWLVDASGVSFAINLAPASGPEQAPTASPGVVAWLAVLWALGSTVLMVRMARRWQGMSALVRASLPLSDEHARLMDRAWPSRTKGARPVIRLSSQIATPCVALASWRPVILLPTDAFRWPVRTLRAVLRHELEHARRGDVWWRLAGEVMRAVWWWHPLVHVLLRRWMEACEQVCDEAVLRSGIRPQSYARSLLALASAAVRDSSPAHAMAFTGRPPSRLRKRVASILSHPASGSASPSWLAWCAIATLTFVLVLAATLRFQHEKAESQSPLHTEAELRLTANPFPGDP
jgi:beta-lactamase regulating signal transducer with metallopeptidase domain